MYNFLRALDYGVRVLLETDAEIRIKGKVIDLGNDLRKER